MRERIFALAAMLLAGSGSAHAADIVVPEYQPESGWTFAIEPYFWAAGMDGTIGQFGLPDVEVDATFSNILKNLTFGFMSLAEARNGAFGVFGDVMYVELSANDGVNVRRINADVDVTSQTFTTMLAGEYRLIDEPGGSLDLLAGGRLWWVSTDVDISGDLNISGSDSATWVDPMVGLKGRVYVTPEFYIGAWGMVGGFGVSSDFAWDALGGIGYAISDSVSLVAGYRALGVDYEQGDFTFDVVEHGPILGAAFTF